MNYLLSIIIPAYKVENYLEKCLQSIIKAQRKNNNLPQAEVIIVDDGSPDSSGKIADAYAIKYPYIKVIHKKNSGVAAARNTGMEAAHGKWLYFVDSDDWLTVNALSILCERALQLYDADVIIFDAWKHSKKKVCSWEHFEKDYIWTNRNDIFRLQCGMLYYPASFSKMRVSLAAPWDKLYKKSFLQKNNLCFPEHLKVLDDMVFNMEVFGQAAKVYYCKDKIYHYRYVSDSITNDYKADRVEQDCKVWKHLQVYATNQIKKKNWTKKEQETFLQSYYCRVIKSFSICCRLSFFNSQNPNNIKEKLAYVNQTLEKKFYKNAFDKASPKNLEWKLKFILFLGRKKCAKGIYLLHIVHNSFFRFLY